LYCVLDEGHIIKNPATVIARAVPCIDSQHRLILSGTPIQNSVQDVWSMFEFLMPGYLRSYKDFKKQYIRPILRMQHVEEDQRLGRKLNIKLSAKRVSVNDDGQSSAPNPRAIDTPHTSENGVFALEDLHKRILPFILRRTKEQVLQDLPPKIVQDCVCGLTTLQRQMYLKEERKVSSVVKVVGAAPSTSFTHTRRLCDICTHPALCSDKGQADMRNMECSGKFLALLELLTSCGLKRGNLYGGHCDDGNDSSSSDDESNSFGESTQAARTCYQHKCLLFAQRPRTLDLIQSLVLETKLPGVEFLRLRSDMSSEKRLETVSLFNADPRYPLILTTTGVGGTGLNITGADVVIFMEHDWNPMKDLQVFSPPTTSFAISNFHPSAALPHSFTPADTIGYGSCTPPWPETDSKRVSHGRWRYHRRKGVVFFCAL
jgi:TATA-binding protein-associated factor